MTGSGVSSRPVVPVPSRAGSTPRPAAAVGVAMVTPFTARGDLDLDATGRLTEYLIGLGTSLLVVSGTTGEATTTSDAEKDTLLRAVLEAAAGRASVMAGVGTADTAHSVELARAAERAGADSVLVVTPYYSRPSQAGIAAHFRAVADATGLSVTLYDIPARSGAPITAPTLIALAAHPRIVGVKDASGDLAKATAVLDATDLLWWSGTDELNLALLALGAVGVISVVGHVAAARYCQVAAAVHAGDLEAARRIDQELLPIVAALMNPGPGAVTAKAALELLGVLPSRATRLPYLPADDGEVARIAAALAATGLATPTSDTEMSDISTAAPETGGTTTFAAPDTGGTMTSPAPETGGTALIHTGPDGLRAARSTTSAPSEDLLRSSP